MSWLLDDPYDYDPFAEDWDSQPRKRSLLERLRGWRGRLRREIAAIYTPDDFDPFSDEIPKGERFVTTAKYLFATFNPRVREQRRWEYEAGLDEWQNKHYGEFEDFDFESAGDNE